MFQQNVFSCLSFDFGIALVVDCVIWYCMVLYWIISSPRFMVKLPLFALSLTMNEVFNTEIHFSRSVHGLYFVTKRLNYSIAGFEFFYILAQ